MSTKTTIKRLALVTVAALGLGVMSVAPSSAVPQADKLTLAATTASTTVGTAVSVNTTLTFSQETEVDSMTLTLSYVDAPSGFTVGEVQFTNPATAVTTDLPAGVTTDTTTASARVAKISAPGAGVFVNKTLAVTLTPLKAGTYVIKVTPAVVGGSAGTGQNITFTVAAKTVAKSTAWISAGVAATETPTADATVSTTGTASTTAKARITVANFYNAAATETATAADAQSVVVATDKGLVSKTNDYTGGAKSVTTAAATAAASNYWVFSNGDVGRASVTITVNGVLLATKTVTFTGSATAIVATAALTNKTWTGIGASKVTTHRITATDAGAGSANVPSGLTVKSSDTTVATVAIASNETVTVTGVKAGTAVITVTDPATTGAVPAITYTVTVKANKSTAATITFDKTAYNAGELVTMTVNADMADSATANVFTAALVGSAAVSTTEAIAYNAGATHAIVGGKATYKFYAPTVSGSWTVTGTTGADVDSTTAATVTGTFDIINAGVDAATAAAEAAEAAAQDATDAALDATTAAEAAGALAQEAVDAVAELAANVTKLFTELNAQIAKLTTLILKVGTSVAKIAAKK